MHWGWQVLSSARAEEMVRASGKTRQTVVQYLHLKHAEVFVPWRLHRRCSDLDRHIAEHQAPGLD